MEGDGSQTTSGSYILLRDYFSKFGEIRECMVMRDPTTKRSRGFGFITFADAASVDKVLAHPHHELDSKMVCLPFYSDCMRDTDMFYSICAKYFLSTLLCLCHLTIKHPLF
uniref:Musashi RNA binding protein 2 n=1 Tax=Sander lucioperca TaxID=283035 RepID=A0A8C9YFG1_SANLU